MHGEHIVIAAFFECEITIRVWMSCKTASRCVPVVPVTSQVSHHQKKYKGGMNHSKNKNECHKRGEEAVSMGNLKNKNIKE